MPEQKTNPACERVYSKDPESLTSMSLPEMAERDRDLAACAESKKAEYERIQKEIAENAKGPIGKVAEWLFGPDTTVPNSFETQAEPAIYSTHPGGPYPAKWRFAELMRDKALEQKLSFSGDPLLINGTSKPQTVFRAASTLSLSLTPDALEAEGIPLNQVALKSLVEPHIESDKAQAYAKLLLDIATKSSTAEGRSTTTEALIASINDARRESLGLSNDSPLPHVKIGEGVSLFAVLGSYPQQLQTLIEERQHAENSRKEQAQRSERPPLDTTPAAQQVVKWIGELQDFELARYTPGKPNQELFWARVMGMCFRESECNPSAIGGDGKDMGLMQIRFPTSARECLRIARERDIPGFDREFSDAEVKAMLMDGKTNLLLGALYYDSLIRRFDGDMEVALMAYNRGPTTINVKQEKIGEAQVRREALAFGYVEEVRGHARNFYEPGVSRFAQR